MAKPFLVTISDEALEILENRCENSIRTKSREIEFMLKQTQVDQPIN